MMRFDLAVGLAIMVLCSNACTGTSVSTKPSLSGRADSASRMPVVAPRMLPKIGLHIIERSFIQFEACA